MQPKFENTCFHALLTFWACALCTATPLRQMMRPRPDPPSLNFDYQADVYDNRVIDEIDDTSHVSLVEKTSSKLQRPQPSSSLPALTAQFVGSSRDRLPSEKELDERILLKLIGSPLDERYLSITQPVDSISHPNGTFQEDFKKGLDRVDLPEEIQRLRFDVPTQDGERTKDIRIKNAKQRRVFRQYLWAHSYCPVVYKWRDLGSRVWPRWINEGDCYRERSCSIPTGMTCKASESIHLTVLYWHCRTRTRCKWIPFKYPIISKCTCGC